MKIDNTDGIPIIEIEEGDSLQKRVYVGGQILSVAEARAGKF